MTAIRSGFLSPQSLQNYRTTPGKVPALEQAAKQSGSEIIFQDKNNQTQIVTLDQYLNHPERPQFKGANSATLALDIDGKTFLIDVQELSQDNLLKAVNNALTKLQGQNSPYTAQFKASAAPIFKSIQTSEASSAPIATKPPKAVTIGSATRNFTAILNPLDSPGDSIDIQVEASAAVKIWGPLGIEASGNAGINISIDDDGLYYVKFTANADIGLSAEGGIKGAKVKGKAAAGGGVGLVYRFNSPEQVNQFLLQKFNDSLPSSVRQQFFPKLQNNTHDVNIRPTQVSSVYVQVSGEVEIGKVKVSASFERRDINRTFFNPKGQTIHSQDYNQTTQVNLKLGDSISLSGTYSEFRIEKDNIPENTGTYRAIEGSINFTFSREQIAKIREDGADAVRDHITNAALQLNLTGAAKEKFIQAALAKAQTSIDALEGKQVKSTGLTIGLAIQAQWEDTADGGSGELQYFRVGMQASVEASQEANLGIVSGSVRASATLTDVTDVVIGNKDETYLAGLYFNNREQYLIAKEKLGGDQAKVGKGVNRKSLSEWEQTWEKQKRTDVTEVRLELNQRGKAERAYQFITRNFKALDSNGNGYIYTDELQKALDNNTFPNEEDQAALRFLLARIATIEELHNDEWGDENDGITLKDIQAFIREARK